MQANLYDGCTMGDLIQRAIERGGDRVAFILDDQKITYREFGSLLSRFIQALAERGVRKGDAIAALSSNRPEAFMASAAAFVMGLRITWMHPLGSEDDHAYLLEDSGVTTLLVDPPVFGERAHALMRRLPALKNVYGFGPNDFGEDILAAAQAYTAAPLQQ